MKQLFYSAALAGLTVLAACSKSDNSSSTTTADFDTLKTTVITDFTNDIAVAGYKDLDDAAIALDASIQALVATPTDVNLLAAQAAWKNTRSSWEKCEGFLIGPVESDDYDPNTDTWPTDYTQMDSLLADSHTLSLSYVQSLDQTLRGYHPIEYLIFGVGGARKASELQGNARRLDYLKYLSEDLLDNVNGLYSSWTGGYANKVLTAGNGSSEYVKKQDLFIALVGGMVDICNEVGTSKMYEPFVAKDSLITESPYSGNTLLDFKNNILSLQKVYLGADGTKGIKDLVAAKNISLDNSIQQLITNALAAFNTITVPYEQAIFTQRTQVQNTMDALATLREKLESTETSGSNIGLTGFIYTYIQD